MIRSHPEASDLGGRVVFVFGGREVAYGLLIVVMLEINVDFNDMRANR